MTPIETIEVIRAAIKSNFPLLIKGAPGIGKSDVVEQACKAEGYDLVIRHPVIEESVDAKGLPGFDGNVAKFFAFEEFARLINADKPLVCFIDDLGQAHVSVQAAYMQIILARQIGGKAISPHVRFVGATNSRKDNAGVSNLITPLVSRFTVIEMTADASAWVKWALANKMPIELCAFLRFRPILISTFDPAKQKDINPFACPRSIAQLGKWINAGCLNYGVWEGCTGDAFALEFKAFFDVYKDLAGLPDKVTNNPQSAPIPDKLDVMYALCGALAHRANDVNFDAIATYGNRLKAAGKGEFQTALIHDCVTRHPVLLESRAYVNYASENAGLI